LKNDFYFEEYNRPYVEIQYKEVDAPSEFYPRYATFDTEMEEINFEGFESQVSRINQNSS